MKPFKNRKQWLKYLDSYKHVCEKCSSSNTESSFCEYDCCKPELPYSYTCLDCKYDSFYDYEKKVYLPDKDEPID